MSITKESLRPGQMYYESYVHSMPEHIVDAYYIILSLFDKNSEPYIQWYDVNQMIVREEPIYRFMNVASSQDIVPLHLVASLED